MKIRDTHRGRLAASMLLAILMTLALDREVVAQGTSGTFAGPITSVQLDRYADRLGLSDQQRMAVESAHDAYKRQFRVLRDGEIAAFLKRQHGLQGGIPKRDVVDDLLEEMQTIQARISGLDRQLFDRIMPILTESQQQLLPRIRLARERVTYTVQQTAFSYGRPPVDVSELFLDLDLEPAVVEAADPQVASYERTLTAKLRKQADAVSSLMSDLMTALEARGYIDLTQEELLADTELLTRLMEDMQGIYGELSVGLRDGNADIRKLNMQTYRTVAAMLPEPAGRELRNAYFRKAYPEFAMIVGMSEEPWLEHWSRDERLDDAAREALAVETSAFQREIDRVLAEGVEVSDTFWANISPFEMGGESATTYQEDIGALVARANEAKSKLVARLAATLGEDEVDRIRTSTPAKVEIQAGAAPAGTIVQDVADGEFVWSGDQFLPVRISRRELAEYAGRLSLGDDVSAVLSAMYDDYVERYEQIEQIDEIGQAKADQMAAMQQGGGADEVLERVYTLRREAVAAIEAVDATLFDDLQTLAGAEHAAAISAMKHERVLTANRGSALGGFALGSDLSTEAGIDLVSLIRRQRLDAGSRQTLQPILGDYLEQAVPAFRARFRAQLDLQRLSEAWTAQISQAVQDDIAEVVEMQRKYTETMQGPAEAVSATNKTIIALNRETMTRIRSMLPDPEAIRLGRAYDVAAYPSIFNDPGAADEHIDAALALRDLDPAQRQQLAELAIGYRPEYRRISEEMKGQLTDEMTYVIGIDQERILEWQARQEQMSRLRFDRNELNARAVNRIRIILNEDQLGRLGPLPEQEDVTEWPWAR